MSSAILLADLGEFLQDFVDGEPRQAVQLQFEDGVDLGVAEADATSSARPYFLRSSLTPFSVSLVAFAGQDA